MRHTILLAAYNGEAYLPEQLDSLAGQTLSDFTVLYQDDGSTDRTADILADRAGKDSRFRPGREQGRHLGAKGNFISLLRQAEGDWFFLCDQDDVWEPDKMRLMTELARSREERNEMPTLIHSDASVVDAEGNQLAPSFFRLEGWDPGARQLNRLLVQNNATGCLMMLNRPLADLVIRYGNPETMFMHDWFIALTAAAFGRILFVDRQLVRYRQHGGNAIGASSASLPKRAIRALKEGDSARARIALSYSHTRAFAEAYGDALPAGASKTVQAYLETEKLPKLRRLAAVRRLGCTMQSPITRIGQIIFG